MGGNLFGPFCRRSATGQPYAQTFKSATPHSLPVTKRLYASSLTETVGLAKVSVEQSAKQRARVPPLQTHVAELAVTFPEARRGVGSVRPGHIANVADSRSPCDGRNAECYCSNSSPASFGALISNLTFRRLPTDGSFARYRGPKRAQKCKFYHHGRVTAFLRSSPLKLRRLVLSACHIVCERLARRPECFTGRAKLR